MEKSCFLIVLLTTTMLLAQYCLVACFAMRVTNINTDQSALLALKSRITIVDPNHILEKNWSTTRGSVCDWIGVICSTRHNRVAALNLSSMGLIGTIPPHVGNLSFLVSLNIRNNSFHGYIPKELANLRRLKYLSVRSNYFVGQIPLWYIDALPELQFLFLGTNNFTGPILPSLSWNGSKLETLHLNDNPLKGEIPQEIGNLQNLKWLGMESNQLTGSIPLSIFNMSSLQTMGFTDNALSGNLPDDMCYRLTKLQFLHISWNELHGKIPSSLYRCSELQIVSLSFNKFGGPIPSEIGNLTMLKELYIGANYLEGEIPQELGNLKVLEVLSIPNYHMQTGLVPSNIFIPSIIFNISSLIKIYLHNNSLSGSLPMDMCHHLPNLQDLILENNKFTGIIPKSIGNCTFLKNVDLSSNNFAGPLPDIGKLRLNWFSIYDNSVIGPIPSNIFNITTLQVLSLSKNHLSGYLPSDIGNWLPNIEWLVIAVNELSGIIPDSISNASKLVTLDIGYNLFTGFIPDTLGNLKLIELLYFEENNLTSKSSVSRPNFLTSLTKCKQLKELGIARNPLNIIMPITIGNISSLEFLDANGCNIMGSIPRVIGNLSKLITIDLGENVLFGEIPTTVGQLSKLQYFNLGGNKLQGSIPNKLCDLRNLGYLILSRNKFHGSLPACLENLMLLRNLVVDSNGLTSTIPLTLWNLKDLLILDLSSNSLSGELPFEIGNLKVVIQIDLSMNQLSGNIPSSLGSLQNLVNLSITKNRLQGPIPKSFGSLISLEFLDLSQNNLSGVIPKSLEQLKYLRYLNLSSNKLEGEIPEEGPFSNFTAQSFLFNKALCGVPRFQVQPCITAHHRSRETMVLLKYILPIFVSVVLVVGLVFVLTGCCKRKTRIPNQENLLPATVPKRFSYQELLNATSGFRECNLLGRGSFSSVYKGIISDGMSIAIKVFDLQLEGSLKSFDIECEVMRNVRHRNLVKVIGSCSNLDFKALVVDYMPNGSLEKWLYDPNYCLDILQRINIMIDVASALEYLHNGCSTPVVHCDIKPSNVLLDENMVAYLSDYGITKLLGKEESMAQTKTLATLGYIAPEYGSEGIVSTKSDVYSYGITLLETFTRKKPTEEMFVGEMSLKHWVKESLPYKIIKVIDGNILSSDDAHFSVKEHYMKSIMELAISCCAESPEERINIKDVVATLKKVKVVFQTNIQREIVVTL